MAAMRSKGRNGPGMSVWEGEILERIATTVCLAADAGQWRGWAPQLETGKPRQTHEETAKITAEKQERDLMANNLVPGLFLARKAVFDAVLSWRRRELQSRPVRSSMGLTKVENKKWASVALRGSTEAIVSVR